MKSRSLRRSRRARLRSTEPTRPGSSANALRELVVLLELVRERGRGRHQRQKKVGQRPQRLAAGAEDERLPGFSRALEHRHQARAHEGGLTRARGAYHRHQWPVTQAAHQGGDLPRAAEEAVRIGLLEGAEARIGALVDTQLADIAAGKERLQRAQQRARILEALLLALEQAPVDELPPAREARRVPRHAGAAWARRGTP